MKISWPAILSVLLVTIPGLNYATSNQLSFTSIEGLIQIALPLAPFLLLIVLIEKLCLQTRTVVTIYSLISALLYILSGTSLIPLLLIIICIRIGKISQRIILNKSNPEHLIISFSIGYILIGAAASVPFFISGIGLVGWEKALFQITAIICIADFLLPLIRKLRNRSITPLFSWHLQLQSLQKKRDPDHNISRILLPLIILSFYFASRVIGFNIDDINGYIYHPIQSVLSDKAEIDPAKPATLMMMTGHSQYFFSLIASNISPEQLTKNQLELVYLFKTWNAISYSTLAIASLLFILKVSRSPKTDNYIWCATWSLPVVIQEILISNTNFTCFLASVNILCLIIYCKSSDKNILTSISANNCALAGGLICFLQPKAIAAIAPLLACMIIYQGYLNYCNHHYYRALRALIIQICFTTIPFGLILVRNYMLTGNPTFPSSNVYWKSPLFETTGFVADKFRSSIPFGAQFGLSFLFPSRENTRIFYGIGEATYGFLPGFLCAVIFLTIGILIIQKIYSQRSENKLIENNMALTDISYVRKELNTTLIYAALAISGAFTVHITAGDQYLYFITPVIYLTAFLVSAAFLLLSLDLKICNLVTPPMSVALMIQASMGWVLSPPSPLPLRKGTVYEKQHLFSSKKTGSGASYDWQQYVKTAEKIRHEIELHSRSVGILNPVIGMTYYQGKIFFTPYRCLEIDWYDYPFLKSILRVSKDYESTKNLSKAIKGLRQVLASYEITHFIVSPGGWIISDTITEAVFDTIFTASDGTRLLSIRHYQSSSLK